ncbi:MAG TPA: LysR family transcriptional regulator [Thermoanaerobaculia bacterium]|nr:LysR family transcriptional regulator [Thermoanaerobaculia bacterium]
MNRDAPVIRPRIRIVRGAAVALGPGKAALLAAVEDCGSISEAARRLGMSYRRAWDLIDTMNAEFREPLVVTRTGGRRGGGASLSDAGRRALALYRAMEEKAKRAIEAEMRAMRRLLRR